jgi:hypothetical protein
VVKTVTDRNGVGSHGIQRVRVVQTLLPFVNPKPAMSEVVAVVEQSVKVAPITVLFAKSW